MSLPHINKVQDDAAKKALQNIHDRLAQIERRALGIGSVTAPLSSPLDSNSHKLTNLADPTDNQDAVTKGYLAKFVAAAIQQQTQSIAPSSPTPPDPGGGGGTTGGGGGGGGGTIQTFMSPQVGTGLVHIDGLVFRLAAGGAIWPWRGCTDFLLYKKYLDGVDISGILANRMASGANLVRVLGMCQNITIFHPADYPAYFTKLPLFLGVLAGSGMWCEFTVFADAQTVMPGTTDQTQHLNAVAAALAGVSNVFLELVNEYPQNGVDPGPFARPVGILSSAGSGLGGDLGFVPPWDYSNYHSPRDDDWPRKSKDLQDHRDGNDAWQGFKRPCVADEPIGAAEVAIPGSRSSTPDDFYWYGIVAQMFGAGATFHSTDGITSDLFQPVTQSCANSFFAGMVAASPDTQLWSYTRGGLSNNPIQHTDALALRTYSKIDPGGHNAISVAVRPQPGWVAIGQDGWTIVNQIGPGLSVVFLTK